MGAPEPAMRQRDELLAEIDDFVGCTRQAIFVRRADQLLLIRPDKTMALNSSALDILDALYSRSQRPAAEALEALSRQLEVPFERLTEDAAELVRAVGSLLNEEYRESRVIRHAHFDRSIVRYPTLAEIAVTYGCQNRCTFCYASSPHREGEHRLMSTTEVKLVMDKIFHQAHVPSLSFTGGEATLRRDLPELIRHGHELGFRVNLISNGLRLAEASYCDELVDAGLDSAQISLEAGNALLHDTIVGRPGAFLQTVGGVRNLRRRGLHVHTNTTMCPANIDHLEELIRFVGRDLQLQTMSMNMVIRTGEARSSTAMEVSYSRAAERIPQLLEVAAAEGVRLVWYSPLPYCIFNPVLHGLGAKSCACVDGILSVDPAGQVLPCSSFNEGIGSLLEQSFDEIYGSRAARYWRRKEFAPPVCRDCPDVDVCAGACPLYWDAAGSFAEIPRRGADDRVGRRRWEKRRRRGKSFGVPAPERGE